jgi:DNA polymerase-3 subunit gamma/tau
VAEPLSVAPPAAAPIPGGIDTDAIRRSWPDILAKIFTIRRATWTFLSEHTQVLDYDGKRLLLGIQTEGLTTTFRRGQHAELVRQALSEVLGVEAVVEGIPATQAERPGPPIQAAAPSSGGSSSASPSAGGPSDGAALTRTPPQAAATSPADAPSPAASTSPAQTSRAARPEPASTPMQRARAQVAQEVSDRNTSSSPSAADDSMVSADDEDIEEAVAAGQPVIARVLGGTVIGELDQ